MAEIETTPDEERVSTDLAFARTSIAEERTLMAWIRTTISLISFGFTIYTFFQESPKNTSHFLTPREVGLIMIGMGLLGLLLAQIEYYKAIRHLKKLHWVKSRISIRIMSILVWIFGLSLFLAALYRD